MTIFVGDKVVAGIVRYRPLFSDAGVAELHEFARVIGASQRQYRAPPKAAWSHYRITDAQAGAAFRSGAVKADRIKLVECSCGPRAAKALAKKLRMQGAA